MMDLRRRGKRIRDKLEAASGDTTPTDETHHITDWTQPLPPIHIPTGHTQLRSMPMEVPEYLVGNAWQGLGPPQRNNAPPAKPGRPPIHPETIRRLEASMGSINEAMSDLLEAVRDATDTITNAFNSIAEAINGPFPTEEAPQQPPTSPTRAHIESSDLPRLADLWRAISIGWVGDQVLNVEGPALTWLLWRADTDQLLILQGLATPPRPRVKLPGGDVVVLHSATAQQPRLGDTDFQVLVRYLFVGA